MIESRHAVAPTMDEICHLQLQRASAVPSMQDFAEPRVSYCGQQPVVVATQMRHDSAVPQGAESGEPAQSGGEWGIRVDGGGATTRTECCRPRAVVIAQALSTHRAAGQRASCQHPRPPTWGSAPSARCDWHRAVAFAASKMPRHLASLRRRSGVLGRLAPPDPGQRAGSAQTCRTIR